MKFVYLQPSDVVNLVQSAGQGQPDWLAGWFNFWSSFVSANPSFILYSVGALELLLGFVLVLGFMRKVTYFGGIILSLIIWSIDEGFGGPYGPGSTDIGAAIIYVFVFLALLIIDSSSVTGRYSLDAIIERKTKWWSELAGFGEPNQRQ
jgi:nitrite reductase (NO-forming)